MNDLGLRLALSLAAVYVFFVQAKAERDRYVPGQALATETALLAGAQWASRIAVLISFWAVADISPTAASFALLLMALSSFLLDKSLRAAAGVTLLAPFSIERPGALVTGGPYRWIRHPIYLCSILSIFAGIAAAPTLMGIVALSVLIVMFVRAADFEEAQFRGSFVQRDYEQYAMSTGKFLPVPAVLLRVNDEFLFKATKGVLAVFLAMLGLLAAAWLSAHL